MREAEKTSLNDCICLCKYGRVFRGNKVHTAEKYGAKAVLLYDDPFRGAPSINNMTNPNIYPNGECMPKFGTQRGTINIHEGDPLTPSYPSIGKEKRKIMIKNEYSRTSVISCTTCVIFQLYNIKNTGQTV